jgi:hypothetical protein
MPKLQYPRLPIERQCVGGVPGPSFNRRVSFGMGKHSPPRVQLLIRRNKDLKRCSAWGQGKTASLRIKPWPPTNKKGHPGQGCPSHSFAAWATTPLRVTQYLARRPFDKTTSEGENGSYPFANPRALRKVRLIPVVPNAANLIANFRVEGSLFQRLV